MYNETPRDDKELPSGIHPQISDLAKRISAATAQTEKMLDRVRGSRPQTPSDQSTKIAQEPSMQDWVRGCHSRMGDLENLLNELQVLIA